jgi:hypothetical protein
MKKNDDSQDEKCPSNLMPERNPDVENKECSTQTTCHSEDYPPQPIERGDTYKTHWDVNEKRITVNAKQLHE